MWELKEASIGPPKIYLGGTLRIVELENGTRCWTFGSAQYVKSAVQNVESLGGTLIPGQNENFFKIYFYWLYQ